MGKVTTNVPSACFSQCQHVDELGKPGEAAVTILPSPVFHLSSDALKTESKRKKKQELKINFSSGYLLITIINNLITIINNLITIINNLINITYNIHTNIINKINLISIINNLGYGTG